MDNPSDIDNVMDDGEVGDDNSRASGSDDHSSSANSKTNSSGTEHTPSEGTSSNSDPVLKGQLGKRETQNISRLRLIVVAILVLAAIGVSILVLYVSRSSENDEFETQYESAAARITEAFETIRTDRIAILANLAVAVIAHGVDHSRDWPFVSLSSFQQRAFIAKQNSGALQVGFASLVKQEVRSSWESYVVSNEADVDWIESAVAYQSDIGVDKFIKDYGKNFRSPGVNSTYPIQIMTDHTTGTVVELEDDTQPQYLPQWEMSPFLRYDQINVDLLQQDDDRERYSKLCLEQGGMVISDPHTEGPGGIDSPHFETSTWAQLLSIDAQEKKDYLGDPMTNIFIPIFDSFEDDRRPVAVMIGLFNWATLFKDFLPSTSKGIDVVLRNTCYDPYTFRIDGPIVTPVGHDDHHDRDFDEWERVTPILESGKTADGTRNGLSFAKTDCNYFLSIYPSTVFEDEYKTNTPYLLVSAVFGVMLFSVLMFFVYDRLVERRQSLVLQKAVQSSAIVSSLFPKNVRDRLMNVNSSKPEQSKAISAFRDRMRPKGPGDEGGRPKNDLFLPEDDEDQTIADLFPNCTVLFADISGFTAWSSTRDPSQVFTLLQNLYSAFDKIALRRSVFKVETIGDSYVAVTGLPEPQADHATIMAKFARDCLNKMHEVTSALEVRLGPDTTDLSMRFGMNSGQVTGGVLRGDRARFQLFGDTVNTAARMESTGERERIQISQATADLLILAGKERWIRPRKESVTAKGKGTMQTYWLEMDGTAKSTSDNGQKASQSVGSSGTEGARVNASFHGLLMGSAKKQERLVGWMTEVLLDYVKQIAAKNHALLGPGQNSKGRASLRMNGPTGKICLDELVESFDLPTEREETHENYRHVELDASVADELRQYVADIACRYQPTNPFHNFDHACHVTMSVHKLMKRIVGDVSDSQLSNRDAVATYSIVTSDPLTMFATVFTALIHDVDHRGVSNAQLAKESPALAEHYRNKSIAEQNSFDVAWNLLMAKQYDNLRKAIFTSVADMQRFRQVVVNTVLATDIFDKEMGDMRKGRWNRIFGSDEDMVESADVMMARKTKATIVLEHIIQASDVSHTMQHWHVYIKWNRKLFQELYQAYKQGRMGIDPATFWYEGELGFYDNYVIPLANKLKECQVFGVSSDEYLNYALSNRAEWAHKGKEIVKDMVEEVQKLAGQEN